MFLVTSRQDLFLLLTYSVREAIITDFDSHKTRQNQSPTHLTLLLQTEKSLKYYLLQEKLI